MYTCNECGNPLYRKYGERWLKNKEQEIPQLYHANSEYGARVLRESRELHAHYKGRYGCNGANRFCNTLCAIRWANKRARPVVRGGTIRTAYVEAMEAIEMFLEYRDKHGYDENRAKAAAAIEVSEQ